jgi:hypothetical protein
MILDCLKTFTKLSVIFSSCWQRTVKLVFQWFYFRIRKFFYLCSERELKKYMRIAVQWMCTIVKITAKQEGIGSETVQNSKQFSAKYPGQCRTVPIGKTEQWPTVKKLTVKAVFKSLYWLLRKDPLLLTERCYWKKISDSLKGNLSSIDPSLLSKYVPSTIALFFICNPAALYTSTLFVHTNKKQVAWRSNLRVQGVKG